jgi:hypothetical protein
MLGNKKTTAAQIAANLAGAVNLLDTVPALDPGVKLIAVQNAVEVTLAGTAAVRGTYTYRGESNNKPYYNLVGEDDAPLVNSLVNEGASWAIYGGAVRKYTSDDVEHPWLGVWAVFGGGALPVPAVAVAETAYSVTPEQVQGPESVPLSPAEEAVAVAPTDEFWVKQTDVVVTGLGAGGYHFTHSYNGLPVYNSTGTGDEISAIIGNFEGSGVWEIRDDLGTVVNASSDMPDSPYEADWTDSVVTASPTVKTVTRETLVGGFIENVATDPVNDIKIDALTGKVQIHADANLEFTSGGDISLNGNSIVGSNYGTYNPTLFDTLNIAASTPYMCQWLRVGDAVTVSGRVTVDPTAAGNTLLGISLPVSTSLAGAEQCAGVAFSPGVAGLGAAILADNANEGASMQWMAADVSRQDMYFTFTYQVNA